MRTPIVDFLKCYSESGIARFHMPGHKGSELLGCEKFDITEVNGADFLYESAGIISESEAVATSLFASRKTCYSTEGSSQCIRAMLYLAFTQRQDGALPLIVAARNAHKAFIYAAATIGFDIKWLYPKDSDSLCRCNISASELEDVLESLSAPPAAVYVTSVDYLGGMADIASLASVCHKHNTVLAVDNAHGAYLHFLKTPIHPLDLGADICCDSAHKTLPALTGGAYLHIGKNAPIGFSDCSKSAMEIFGSTSPSYLTMASLDLCNKYLSDSYAAKLEKCINDISNAKLALSSNGWCVEKSDPLRITLRAPEGLTGIGIAQMLREKKIECEYADRMFVVFMLSTENTRLELDRLTAALGVNEADISSEIKLELPMPKRVMSVRDAMFSQAETVNVKEAVGRICASPTVSCPPAIPIAVSGEKIDADTVKIFEYYGIDKVDVVASKAD